VTRAVVFTLDPSPAQDRMLRNYLGAGRGVRLAFDSGGEAALVVSMNLGLLSLWDGFAPPVLWLLTHPTKNRLHVIRPTAHTGLSTSI
jgi:hypothetical protein